MGVQACFGLGLLVFILIRGYGYSDWWPAGITAWFTVIQLVGLFAFIPLDIAMILAYAGVFILMYPWTQLLARRRKNAS